MAGTTNGFAIIGADELCNFPGSSRLVGKNEEPVETGEWHSVLVVGGTTSGTTRRAMPLRMMQLRWEITYDVQRCAKSGAAG